METKKDIVIETQEEWDKIKEIKSDENVVVVTPVRLNCDVNVFGFLTINMLSSSFCLNALNLSKITAQGFGKIIVHDAVVHAYDSTVVFAYNSDVFAFGSSIIYGFFSSSIRSFGSSKIFAFHSSHVLGSHYSKIFLHHDSSACVQDHCTVVGINNSYITASGHCKIDLWDFAYASIDHFSSLSAHDFSCVRVLSSSCHLSLFGFSTGIIHNSSHFTIKKEKNCVVKSIPFDTDYDFFLKHSIPIKKDKAIIFKSVSENFETQEGMPNQTKWEIGKTLVCKNFNPQLSECGEKKFHGVSHPIFAFEFRSDPNDRFIAIEVKVSDTFQWTNPKYPHKIAFRKGKVLFECDITGRRIRKNKKNSKK